MGEAIKCDLTGKLCEGCGVSKVTVEVRDGVRLDVTPMVRNRKDLWVHGRLSPAGAHIIEGALSVIDTPTPKKKGGQKK